jgi:hypothetical protein
MRITAALLDRALVHIPDRQFSQLLLGRFKLSPKDRVPLATQIKFILVDWIYHLGGYLTDGTIDRILSQYDYEINAYQMTLTTALHHHKHELPIFHLTISDGRYVHTTGSAKWFDLVKDEEIEQLESPCVTHIMCDLTAAFMRAKHKLKLLGAEDDIGSRIDPEVPV